MCAVCTLSRRLGDPDPGSLLISSPENVELHVGESPALDADQEPGIRTDNGPRLPSDREEALEVEFLEPTRDMADA